jgi:hypothetical protein
MADCPNKTIIEHSQILASIPEMQNDIHIIREKLIDGNGKPGLLTRYEVLENKFDNHLDSHTTNSSNGKWFITLVVTILLSLLTNAVALYFALNSNNHHNDKQKNHHYTVEKRIEKCQNLAKK